MNISTLISRSRQNLRFLFVGNERYYPSSRWDGIYREGYHLDVKEQAARYGALLALMECHDGLGPILDVGCGEGILEKKFRRLSSSPMLGVDYSAEAINSANQKAIPGCDFLCANYRECNFSQQFGMIVLNESLYYVDDVLGTLQGLSKYLHPGGVIIVSMFDAFSTRRIWSALHLHYGVLQAVVVKDETHFKSWQIQVLQPAEIYKNESRATGRAD